jgi:hypothetical protein
MEGELSLVDKQIGAWEMVSIIREARGDILHNPGFGAL